MLGLGGDDNPVIRLGEQHRLQQELHELLVGRVGQKRRQHRLVEQIGRRELADLGQLRLAVVVGAPPEVAPPATDGQGGVEIGRDFQQEVRKEVAKTLGRRILAHVDAVAQDAAQLGRLQQGQPHGGLAHGLFRRHHAAGKGVPGVTHGRPNLIGRNVRGNGADLEPTAAADALPGSA